MSVSSDPASLKSASLEPQTPLDLGPLAGPKHWQRGQ